jgi:hypothetical protein
MYSTVLEKRRNTMDPFTLILVIILVIFFFPVILRGVGCLIRTAATVIVIIVAVALIRQFL